MGASDTLLICVYLRHYEVGAGSVQASCRNCAENSPMHSCRHSCRYALQEHAISADMQPNASKCKAGTHLSGQASW